MRAIGRNLIIKKEKQGTSETKGGLLLTENQREDLRYNKAKVISTGSEVIGVKENDNIYYDKHAGHGVEINKEVFQVIKLQDVVIVL
jgi:co-chaperonin GroES (HSP10)|tara:strand:- start:1023 stop:1283 length:261 start_codon:yes stop_codon:yes gene_type:complete